MNDKDIIAAARIRVTNKHPYVAAVLLSLRPIPMPGLGTMGVSADWKLYYDPATLQQWGVKSPDHDGVAAVLAHEVWHALKDHAGRCGGRDKAKWNRAADREINDDLTQAGWRLPTTKNPDGSIGKALMPSDIKQPNGELAELYYEKEPEQKQQGGGEGQCSPGQQGTPGSGGCCGGCSGNPREFENKVAAAQKQGDAQASGSDVDGISAGDREILRRQVAEAVQTHCKGRGTVPLGLKCWADLELEPAKIDWRSKLRANVRALIADKAGKSDYTYARPSRRQWGLRAVMGRAPILPSLHQPNPRVGIVLDTSGSMNGSPQKAALAEVVGIVRATGSPVKAWAVDAAIQATVNLVGARDVEKLNVGGGGTSMANGLRHTDKQKCDLLILITDGYTDWPERGELRTKTLVCITPGGHKPPDWMPCIEIEK